MYQKKQAFAKQTKDMEIELLDKIVPHIAGH